MIPDDVLTDLRGEITAARSTGNVWNTEAWLHAIGECLERHMEPIPCPLCIQARQLGSVKNSCSYCALEPGRLGWRWKPPIVLPDIDPIALVARPGTGARSDVPPQGNRYVEGAVA